MEAILSLLLVLLQLFGIALLFSTIGEVLFSYSSMIINVIRMLVNIFIAVPFVN